MKDTIRAFWSKIPSEDRKLIRLTILACTGILIASLAGLYAYTVLGPEPAAAPSGQGAAGDPSRPPPPLLAGLASDSLHASLPLLDPALLLLKESNETEGPDSFDASAHRELMRLATSQYNYSRALTHAARIAPLYSADPDFQAELGHLYLESGRPKEAIPHLQMALATRALPEAESDLALALFRANQADSALNLLRNALQRHPQHPRLLTQQAAILGEMPDTSMRKNAAPYFEKLIRQYPRYAEARYQYSRFLMSQGNMGSAWTQIQQALKLDPLNPRVQARSGMTLFYLNQDAKAEQAYRTALALNPADYNTWYNLGELYLSQANEASSAHTVKLKMHAALEAYLSALTLEPDLGAAHFRVGMILNGNRQYREAIRHLQTALQSDPGSVRILLQLSSAWEQLGDTTQALNYLEIAHAVDPFHKVVAAHWLRLQKRTSP